MTFKPNGMPIAIGSFPHKTPEEAMALIREKLDRIPLWPQLPMASPEEQMYVQYYEGMPGITYDPDREKLAAKEPDDAFFDGMAKAFEASITGETEKYAISEDKARGIYYFINYFDSVKNLDPDYIKGQVTGPVSFSLVVTDENMKPVLYNESYRQMITEVIKLKALWQIDKFRDLYENIIIFIDEPYMASFGSSMVALSEEDAINMIKNIIDAISDNGALSGVHCCGNTDWPVLFKTGTDMISFDAYEYGEKFLLYSNEIVEYIKNGGNLAWGIVPTSEAADDETADSLYKKLDELICKLAGCGLSREEIIEHSLISPSCGLGNVPVERAERILDLVNGVSQKLK